ncbi:hypothetical protein BC629DRAFT_629202 [Irpex lacteus]|nr:hypothetical protein BC629DRAFT_629202 [Irpex lacteus]
MELPAALAGWLVRVLAIRLLPTSSIKWKQSQRTSLCLHPVLQPNRMSHFADSNSRLTGHVVFERVSLSRKLESCRAGCVS